MEYPCQVLQHPFSYESLRILIDRLAAEDYVEEDYLVEDEYNYEDENDFNYDFDLESLTY